MTDGYQPDFIIRANEDHAHNRPWLVYERGNYRRAFRTREEAEAYVSHMMTMGGYGNA